MEKEDFTILLVEDEEGMRKNMAEYLSLNCEKVYEASNGNEAFSLYNEVSPDLVITDINMPGMDGLTLVEKIREHDQETAVIIISAHSDKDKLFRAIKLNLVEYIVKPIERNTLKELIKKVVKKQGSEVKKMINLGSGFNFDQTNRLLYKDQQLIQLSKQQNALIETLVEHKNRVVSAVDIFFHVQDDYSLEYNSAIVRNLVKKTRKIFPEEMIKNVYGSGYTLIIKEDLLKKHISKYSSFLEAVAIIDSDQNLIWCNDVLVKLFGYERDEEIMNQHIFKLLPLSEQENLLEAMKHEEHISEEVHFRRKDGTLFLAKTRCKEEVLEDRKIRTISILDLSETLKRYALDPLTSLQTRAVLELEFANILRRRQKYAEEACAIFVDIDNFKTINDTQGHLMGDEIIKNVAHLLVQGVRKDDLVIRWGGDEFLILLLNTTISVALRAAEQLRKAILQLDIEGCDITCSFGLDSIKEDDTLKQMIARVDNALLEAKGKNKNCVLQYSR